MHTQTFVFAVAKDGDTYLDKLDASSIDEATDIALGMAADWLGIDGPVDETELGGFTIVSLQGLLDS